ncbi:Zinc finger CCCH domain-containing protein 15 [Bienertia sinuspersici]
MQQDSRNSPMSIASSAQSRTSMTDLLTPPPYSSIFFHSAASPSSYHSASSLNSDRKSTTSATATVSTTASAATAKSLSRMMMEHKDLLSRHAFCLNQLHKIFKEAETLRQENTHLRLANADLSNQVNLLIQATVHSSYQTQPFGNSRDHYGSSSISSIGGGFEKEKESGCWNEGCSSKVQSQKSKIEKDQEENQKDESARVTLPKSISVRSNGFLKSAGIIGCSPTPIRAPSPVSGPQKVYVRGGSQKDGPIELEVYNQGMFKTELCNKWQETGSCPYGDHCQFAHGISELRPVIRHPRYKTEVCRMVLAGDPCPYGHRCHFRHALTDEEKLMLPLRLN